MKFIKTILSILLIPVAAGITKSFYEQVSGISLFSGTLHIMERGILIYALFHLMIARPVYLYVLGHEFVHVLATWLCGGKVVSFNVKPSGGNVVTNKTNVFIELSPYFVPIYTLVLGPAFLVIRHLDIYVKFMSELFIFLVGVTLAFHFIMTSEVLRVEQPDIMKSGFLFSCFLIFVGNLIVIMALFCPIFDQLSFVGFVRDSYMNSRDLYMLAYERGMSLVGQLRGLIS